MRKKIQNNNGITVCDSIVMSVQKKRINTRQAEAVIIAVIGYISAIMAFLTMFDINYSHSSVMISGVIFSVLYILLSVAGKKAMWVVTLSAIGGGVISLRIIDTISTGYKYVYNIIYRTATHKEIDYYKLLSPELEESTVTVFFIFCTWLLAIIIYVFTIYRPEALPPLLVTFPIIEVGLYNGVKISVFWGMLIVSYWFAVFAMAVTDSGEYSGGSGGFVRKENIFFPKRQMRLKVTEKCGMFIIISVIAVTGITSAIIDITDYKRSEKLNEKRIEIRDAVNGFSMEDFTGSVSQLTSAFGFTLKVHSHKLGNVDKLKYKNTDDMTVTIDHEFRGALYLKEYACSVYNNNEWLTLSDEEYKSELFGDFEKYNIYPQDFPGVFNKVSDSLSSVDNSYSMEINSNLRKNRIFAPYGTENTGNLTYDTDVNVSSQKGRKFSYRFSLVGADRVKEIVSDDEKTFTINTADIRESENFGDVIEYAMKKGLDTESFAIKSHVKRINTSDTRAVMAALAEEDYRDFVYKNYLQIPDTEEMDEVRNAFSGLVLRYTATAEEKIQLLTEIRQKITEDVEYTLNCGKTPKSRDFVNYFLLENRKGYCTHYATAGVILARMAGIPARYATGYVIVGDDFGTAKKNSDSSFSITLKDNRSHAWAEVYIDGYGWIPFEFTAGYTEQSIETTTAPPEETTETETETETTVAEAATEETTEQATNAPSGTTTSPQTTTQETTATGRGGSQGGEKINIFNILKFVLYVIAVVAFAIAVIVARRFIILYVRRRRFTQGAHRQRIQYMYIYVEKLLSFKNYIQDDMSYTEFADYVDKSLGGIYFDENLFCEFVEISLRNSFSQRTPDSSDVKKCLLLTEQLSKSIYNKATDKEKIYLKFIFAIN